MANDLNIQPIVRVERFEVRPPAGPPIVVTVVTVLAAVANRAIQQVNQTFNPTHPPAAPPIESARPIAPVSHGMPSSPPAPSSPAYSVPVFHGTPAPTNPPAPNSGFSHSTGGHSHATHPSGGSSNEATKAAEGKVNETSETSKAGMPPGDRAADKLNREPDGLAHFIAKQLIPEKFTFIMPPVIQWRSPHHAHPLKGEKSQPEEQQQKAPASKSEAVAKGEAKTTQQPTVPEEVEPAEKMMKEMFQAQGGKAPIKNADTPTAPAMPKAEAPLPGPGSEKSMMQTLGFTPSENASAPLSANVFNQVANSGILATPYVTTFQIPEGIPQQQRQDIAQIMLTPQTNPTVATAAREPIPNLDRQNPVQPMPQILPSSAISNPNDPAKVILDPSVLGRLANDPRHAASHVKPRQDAIVAVDKKENTIANPQNQKIDDKPAVQIPILPDLPLSREGILKELGNAGGTISKDDKGFKIYDIVLMLLCGVICGARTVDEVFRYLNARETFFKTWLGLNNGLPSYRLLWIVMNRLNPGYFEGLLLIALGKKSAPLSWVRVWETDRGILVGELKEDLPVQSMETIDEALELFDMNGAILTVDQPTLKPSTAKAIRKKGGDYLIALRGKHGNAYNQAQEFFGATVLERNLRQDTYSHVIKESNRTELHEVAVVDDLTWFSERGEWVGLKTTVQMRAEVLVDNRHLTENRLYLSSMPMDAKEIVRTLRAHSTFEGRVEWYLDMDFTKWGIEHSLNNFDLLRQCSWNLLNFEGTGKAAPEVKRKKALTDNTYLRTVLGLKAA